MNISERAPRGWSEKRLVIMNRITAIARISGESATKEELPIEPTTTFKSSSEYPTVSRKGRLDLCQRQPDLAGVIQYNMLEKKKEDDSMIKDWKSYPGLAVIITMAREIMNTGQTTHLEELIELMLGHETQQSAPLIASISILIRDKVSSK